RDVTGATPRGPRLDPAPGAGSGIEASVRSTPTADAETVEGLPRRMATVVEDTDRERPRLRDPAVGSPVGEDQARMVLGLAFAELFNPSQLRALQRLDELCDGRMDGASCSGDAVPCRPVPILPCRVPVIPVRRAPRLVAAAASPAPRTLGLERRSSRPGPRAM